ncbi:MAG: hypothetical protein M1822_006623 [Bathelium mastoideum]|nr:MAG: hypothetical protein M1822_006623 [Bathelium mastoideum]
MDQRVYEMDGEADPSSDDGLDIRDISKRKLRQAAGKTNGEAMAVASDSSPKGVRQRNAPSHRQLNTERPGKGEKVAWSDNEDADAAYASFKASKSLKRKQAIASSLAVKKQATESSVVGKRPKKGQEKGIHKKRYLQRHDLQSTDDEEEALMKETLPEYLRDRFSKWEENRKRMGEAGLKVPPDFDHVDFSDDDQMEHLQERPQFSNFKPCAPYKDIILPYSLGVIPAPIAQWLREYQVKGAEFLHELFVWQKGGILGDDMGLGKTIQVIAFLAAAFGKTGDERDRKRMRKMRRSEPNEWYPRALIICLGSLMDNWQAELQSWGWWQVDVYHGSPAGKEATLKAAQQGRLEIVITTYATYRLNQDTLNTVDWDCVIADECHQVKDRRAEITKAMNEVNALCRIGLTGTAIQNKYDELWTLLNWTNPGRFGPISAWKSGISGPLKIGQSHEATIAQLAKARKTAKALVNNLLPSIFLRRMKSLIADQLPKKSDRVVFCPLTDEQAAAYENYVSSDLVEYIRTSSEICDCGSEKKRGWCCFTHIPERNRWQNYVFPCIVTLQKLSNHIALVIPQSSDVKEKQDKDLDNLQVAMPNDWKELYRERDSIINYANQNFCGKWRILKKLLRFWAANGDKVLVFSHSVRLLKMLRMLFSSTTDYTVSYLDGSMSYEERTRAVNDFNADPSQFVFLISTKAGGVGLNITSANKVVVVDPNWNPAYDLQAQDRAYRIGQTRDVEVFRLVSAGTIEEIVYARQIYKQQQANIGYAASSERRYFRGVQDDKDKKGEIFGLANMFAFHDDSIVLRDIVNKTNVAESKAGVNVIGYDASQEYEEDLPDDLASTEDAAMIQLAKLVEKGERSGDISKSSSSVRTDAVQAILASAGVEYTHENSEVIGSSRVEARLSRKAEAQGNDIDRIGEKVFATSQPEDEEIDHDDNDEDVEDARNSSSLLGRAGFRYHPGDEVRRRQFCTMAQTFGFHDATEFALVVESWTQAQRRSCLEKFYEMRKTALAGEQSGNEEDDDDDLN